MDNYNPRKIILYTISIVCLCSSFVFISIVCHVRIYIYNRFVMQLTFQHLSDRRLPDEICIDIIIAVSALAIDVYSEGDRHRLRRTESEGVFVFVRESQFVSTNSLLICLDTLNPYAKSIFTNRDTAMQVQIQ